MDMNDVMKTFVDQYAPMNPETEFLLPSTDLLQNGMEILIAIPHLRASHSDVVDSMGNSGLHKCLERNRWCKVSHLKYNFPDNGVKNYTFMATYSDGTQLMRTHHVSDSWFVKLSSVDVLQQKRKAVMNLVEDCLIPADPNEPPVDYPKLAASFTEDIMRIFGMGVRK